MAASTGDQGRDTLRARYGMVTFLRSKRLMDRNMRLPAKKAASPGSSASDQAACTAVRAAAEGGSTAGCSTSGTMPRLLSLAKVSRKMPAGHQPSATAVKHFWATRWSTHAPELQDSKALVASDLLDMRQPSGPHLYEQRLVTICWRAVVVC